MPRRQSKSRKSRLSLRVVPREVESASIGTRTLVLAGLGILFLVGAFIWYMQGGGWSRMERGFYRATQSAGLRVAEVFITGRTYVSREDLLATIGAERGSSILALDLDAIHARLLENPWVKAARVERHLPNVLYVDITERAPFAIWQHDQRLRLIDFEGNIITGDALERFEHLPLVVGTGAEKAAAGMLSTLDSYPEFGKQMKALIRVSDRRWDIQLENDVIIKLPELNPAAALERLSHMWQTTNIATRPLKVIDTRLPDRVIIDGADEKPAAEPIR
ncbi:MAG: cell division protein FtsQ/DivIB [Bdellovibrionales bacterium]